VSEESQGLFDQVFGNFKTLFSRDSKFVGETQAVRVGVAHILMVIPSGAVLAEIHGRLAMVVAMVVVLARSRVFEETWGGAHVLGIQVDLSGGEGVDRGEKNDADEGEEETDVEMHREYVLGELAGVG
jgi:hypothetical protein